MKIEDQVCTLEQAKILKELGVVQGKSAFAFIKNKCHDEIKFRLRMVLMEGVSYEGYEDWEGGCLQGYSAYTVAELGEMLPAGCQSNYNDHHGYWVCDWPEVWDEEDEPNARPYAVPGWKITAEIDDEEMQTEAQVRAAMLIHLIESNAITIEQTNKRIQQ